MIEQWLVQSPIQLEYVNKSFLVFFKFLLFSKHWCHLKMVQCNTPFGVQEIIVVKRMKHNGKIQMTNSKSVHLVKSNTTLLNVATIVNISFAAILNRRNKQLIQLTC